jgi:hypothetical protein
VRHHHRVGAQVVEEVAIDRDLLDLQDACEHSRQGVRGLSRALGVGGDERGLEGGTETCL